jgi:PAS domain S-box-containing protein
MSTELPAGLRPIALTLPEGPLAEASVRAQWELLRVTLACIGDAVITTDTRGRVTFLNPVAVSLTGWTQEAAAGLPLESVFHIVHGQDHLPVENPALRALRTGKVVGLTDDVVLIARDGTARPIADSAAPIRDAQGQVAGVVLVFQDVSERKRAEQLALEARTYAESIVETVREPLVVLDADLRVKTANRSFYQTFRVVPAETENRILFDLGNGQWNIPGLRRVLEEILPRNTSFQDFEVEHTFPDIGPRTMRLNARRVYRAGNPTETILFAIEDVTERRQAAHALEASEVRYRRLFEAARDGILILNVETGKIIDANPFMFELLGRGPDYFQGKELWEIGLFQDIEASRAAFRQLREQGYIRYEHLSLETAAGRHAEVEFVSNVYGAGRETVIQCNIRDITARKRTEEALRQSEERYHQLADSMPQMVWTCRPDGACDYWNSPAAGYFGATPEQLLDWGWTDLIHPDDLPETVARWTEALKTGGPYEIEYRLRLADRNYRWHLGRGLPVQDVNGRVVRWIGTCTDIDARKRAEEALKEADRRKNEFLAMLAHELRSPLAPIRNSVQLLQSAGFADEKRQWAREVIDRQVQQLTRLVDDLMDVSRITRGKIHLRLEPVDLAAVVARAVEISRPLLDARRHQLNVALLSQAVWVEGDPTRLAQILSNLLNNAAKYTDEGGRIELAVEKVPAPLGAAAAGRGEVLIRVRDTGLGIAPEMLPNVFDLYTQIDRTLDHSQGGLGLGLTLVRRLAEMHGGSVAAFSDGPGRGSEFVVRLPLLTETSAARTTEVNIKQALEKVPARRILVVDDSHDAADSLTQLLRLYGHEVYTAHAGPAALEAARAHPPDVALLDISLPGMDGLELARCLRQNLGLTQALLVAVTGYGGEEDRRRSREAGFNAHLVKPVDLSVLHTLLAQPEAVAPSAAGS